MDAVTTDPNALGAAKFGADASVELGFDGKVVFDTDSDTEIDVTLATDGDVVSAGKYVKIELINANREVVATAWGEGNGSSNLCWGFVLKGGLAAGDYTVKVSSSSSSVESAPFTVGSAAANKAWKGHTIKTTAGDSEAVFADTGKAVNFGVASISDVEGKTVALSNSKVAYYYAGSDFNTNDGTTLAKSGSLTSDAQGAAKEGAAPSEVGCYVMAVYPTNDYMAGVTEPQLFKFEIVAGDVETTEYSLYEINSGDDTDLSDTTFVYDGTNILADNALASGGSEDGKADRIGLLVDGEASDLYLKDSSVQPGAGTYYVIDPSSSISANKTVADSYSLPVYKVTLGASSAISSGTYDETTLVAYVDFNVEKFDLSKATVSAADVSKSGTPEATLSYNGSTYAVSDLSNLKDNLKVTVDSYDKALGETVIQGHDLTEFDKAGSYEFSISLADATLKTSNFTMSGDAAKGEIRVMTDAPESVFNYSGDNSNDQAKGTLFTDHRSAASAIVVDASAGDEFDFEKISWGSGPGTFYDADKKNATVTVTDVATGEVVAAPSATGLYVVNVQLPTGVKYDQGGSSWFYVKVIDGSANVYFNVDGKPASNTASVKEDGQPVDLSVVVKTTGKDAKVLKEGTDYTVEIKDVDAKKTVDEIVTFGTYEVTVKSAGYKLADATLTVKVTAAEFDGVQAEENTYGYLMDDYKLAYKNAAGNFDLAFDQDKGIAYTGETVVPTFQLYIEKTVDGETVKALTELDPETYTVSYVDNGTKKAVEAEDLVKVGSYTATLDIDQEAFEKVYGEDASIDAGFAPTVTFEIVDTIDGGFSDVKASAWYADEATKAKQLGYMQGLSGTSMLLPEASITRADVAMVLMRMAGGEPNMEQFESHPTKFSDVESFAYYAKAIDWAYKAGVVTGDDGADTFRPNDQVTREELATMLGRFAEKVQGEDVSAGAIEGYADADAVQDFALEGMSWCVENGVFGVNTTTLDPQGDATRAQVAAIAVRVVPAVEKDA